MTYAKQMLDTYPRTVQVDPDTYRLPSVKPPLLRCSESRVRNVRCCAWGSVTCSMDGVTDLEEAAHDA
jgi:hypothetical protein